MDQWVHAWAGGWGAAACGNVAGWVGGGWVGDDSCRKIS